jgi:hypothetical protein
MQPSETFHIGRIIERNFVARPGVPLLAGFFGKFMLDILPAALASVIGGFLFTQYQAGHPATRIATEQVTPASAEMMAMVRDEHAMMMDYLKSQMVAEKSRADAEDAARAAAQAKAAAGATADTDQAGARPASDAPTLQIAVASVTSQAASDRTRRPVAAVPRAAGAPLVIAQADQGVDQVEGVAPGDRLASDPNSLLAKTLDLKDHVVAATRHVVAAIGDVLASVGESIGGSATSVRQFNPAS